MDIERIPQKLLPEVMRRMDKGVYLLVLAL
jgi:hypothetical protein